jgi:hypothetical protein
VLNDWDETGMPVNRVSDATIKTGLAEVPNTPAYRQQQQQQIATSIGALAGNPQAVQILTPTFIEATSLPNRQQVADDIRKASGIPLPGDKQAQAKAEEQQQRAQEQQQALQETIGQATAAEKQASAAHKAAQADKTATEAVLLKQQVGMNAQPQMPSEDEMIQQALAEAA